MNKGVVTFLTVCGAIVTTGIVLDFAGRGALGTAVQGVAKRVTSGYGDD